MTAVVIEVVAGIVAVRPLMRTPVPAVRTSVTATAIGGASPTRAALARTTAAQAGQRLRDGFGGVLLGGVARFRVVRFGVVRVGGHDPILHAT
ncbi:hypothetical protein [Microbacterium sp. Se63.02b]|uniref:hypothetical protein n=1 Tax=Microbacterium sp. Se63.02b TaxID=2709304 RepID=UPI0016050AFF|nr:hypothetical protein [Microbacterium sp. Se63.02b]QNA93884.1 hypothetical protein G4G29_19255 [Microbacterium sp. Se63.02b]